VAQKNDQIFQLSLTEIVFCIVFILLLLLGYQVINEQQARKEAENALALVQSVDDTRRRMEDARAGLVTVLSKAGATAPNEVITKLVEEQKMREERDRLRKQVEDLDAKLTALTELQKLIERGTGDKAESAKAAVTDALILQAVVQKELGEPDANQTKKAGDTRKEPASTLNAAKQAIATANTFRVEVKSKLSLESNPMTEGQTVVDIVDAAKSFGELNKGGANVAGIKKENSDLRGQVAFLKRRLDARGGRDYPPCWADESGKVEFLFAIELKDDAVVVTPAWPTKRDADAKALPDIQRVLEAPFSLVQFPERVLGVFNWSKKQDPECRHYVQLRSTISDAVRSDRARLMVENYFYKVELRR
jgi:hypothetical protein